MKGIKRKTKIVYVLILLFAIFSCKNEKRHKNEVKKIPVFKITSTDTISFGYHNQIYDIKETKSKDFRMLLNISNNDVSLKSNNKFITISKEGRVKDEQNISFKHSLTDYVEFGNGFYTINTLRVTMGKNYTHDFLSKYDTNWNLLWEKELKTHKYPAGNSFIRLFDKDSLMLITDSYNKKEYGFAIQKFDKKGTIMSNVFFNKYDNPLTVTKTFDNHFLISTFKTKSDSLILIKKEINNKTIWKKTLDKNIYPKQIFQTKDKSFIIYGTIQNTNSRNSLIVFKIDKKGKIIWEKSINMNYYEQAGNVIENKNNFVFSSAITPTKDNGSFAYIFELDNNGKLISDKKFDFMLGISSVPYLIDNNERITMISQKWIGEFGDPFHDILIINRIKKQ
ncbi:hypothetical protein [Tenacibaculum sp. nBUS_03]|uniref:hypothetical protein n=1 Tax=Tenacibaculum sp. nBUS_03 TaxID=3395320 RepID=UPI003EBC6EE5